MKYLITTLVIVAFSATTLMAQSPSADGVRGESTRVNFDNGSRADVKTDRDGNTTITHTDNNGNKSLGVSGNDKHKEFVKDAIKEGEAGGAKTTGGSNKKDGRRSKPINPGDYRERGPVGR